MSRLECKDCSLPSGIPSTTIRICPDWNVKEQRFACPRYGSFIRICPDWNVKGKRGQDGTVYSYIRICPDWNVKRYLNIRRCQILNIRICPDWNVKLIYAPKYNIVYYQNMSRLECKVQEVRQVFVDVSIRICPDWNVKSFVL